MKTCEQCGNEVENTARVCPFCEQPQARVSAEHRRVSRIKILTVNLEEGHPLVDEALNLMERRLYDARLQGTKVVRLIHGYGSSGTGGAIKVAVRQKLSSLCERGSIKRYVGGEEYLVSDAGRSLRSQYSQLKSSLASDQGNPGITLVEL